MKIIELEATAVKRLKAVRIRPDGAMVQITGANGNGKTSVLDAIWLGLKGRQAGVAEPIRKGEKVATIRLDLGDYQVLRRFTRGEDGGEMTVDLTVTDAAGKTVRKSPQAVLDGFLGQLSFDPLAFARAKAADQYEMLKRLVPGFDFEANAQKRKALFDERTDVNRVEKNARAAAAAVILPAGPKPAPIDVSAKIDEMALAAEHNASVTRAREERGRRQTVLEAKRDEAETLRARAATLEGEAEKEEKFLDLLDELPALVDVDALRAEIAKAEDVKRAVEQFEARERHESAAKVAEAQSNSLTTRIDDLKRARATAIADAKMPVKGLTLGEDDEKKEVLLEGVPFGNGSDAEQLRASLAIAMALNPGLRVIRVHEGSVLDTKSLTLVAEMAAAHDFQVWVERVEESGKVGFVIVDGEVAA